MAPRKAPIVACQRDVRGGWDEIEGWFTGMVDRMFQLTARCWWFVDGAALHPVSARF